MLCPYCGRETSPLQYHEGKEDCDARPTWARPLDRTPEEWAEEMKKAEEARREFREAI